MLSILSALYTHAYQIIAIDRTISDIVNLQDVFLESSKLGRFWLVLFEIFTLIGRLIGRLIFYTFTNTTSGLEFKWRFVSPFKL